MVILNYIVTSNLGHLLVADDGDRMTIPRSIQLVAGRTGQEYNQNHCDTGNQRTVAPNELTQSVSQPRRTGRNRLIM